MKTGRNLIVAAVLLLIPILLYEVDAIDRNNREIQAFRKVKTASQQMLLIASFIDHHSTERYKIEDLAAQGLNIVDPFTQKPFTLLYPVQDQTHWKLISAGPDGLLESTAGKNILYSTTRGIISKGDVVVTDSYMPNFGADSNAIDLVRKTRVGEWQWVVKGDPLKDSFEDSFYKK